LECQPRLIPGRNQLGSCAQLKPTPNALAEPPTVRMRNVTEGGGREVGVARAKSAFGA